MKILLCVFVALATVSAPGDASKLSDLTKIIDSFQKKWDATKTYKANFKQIIVSKQMGTRDETNGIVYVAKPNRLRWESETDGSFQILNGKRLVSIQTLPSRGSRSVDIYRNISKSLSTKPLQFLIGKVRFVDAYDVSLLGDTPNQAELKLMSKSDPLEIYTAEIDKPAYFLRTLKTSSPDSEVTIQFTGIETNLKLRDELFKYQKQPNDVVHEE